MRGAHLAPDGIDQIGLSRYDVPPGGGGGVLEVGDHAGDARGQRLVNRPALGRPDDLDPPVREVVRRRRHLPSGVADRAGGCEEVRSRAAREVLQAPVALEQKLLAHPAEAPLQLGQEFQRRRRQHPLQYPLRGRDFRTFQANRRHGAASTSIPCRVVSAASGNPSRGSACPSSQGNPLKGPSSLPGDAAEGSATS